MNGPSDLERVVGVELGAGSYHVFVGAGLLERAGTLASSRGIGRSGGHALIVFDTGLALPDVLVLRASLEAAGFLCDDAPLEAKEPQKSLQSVELLLHALAASGHERGDPIFALGGGITGDVAGFAAAVYRRGVPIVQCPTTLLAMVDASVGGKTGVNLAVGTGGLQKNVVGAFHQPRLVIADVGILSTLPDREFSAGLAECVKHGLIGAEAGDAGLLAWTETMLGPILVRDEAALIELIARNVAVKAAIVSRDEREEDDAGGRALLNLGHTFGHALETLPEVRAEGRSERGLLHGEAVGLGLIAAAVTAGRIGIAPASLVDQVEAMVSRCGLPVRAEGMPVAEEMLRRMMSDKKVKGGKLRLVLPESEGRARLVEGPDERAVRAGLAQIARK